MKASGSKRGEREACGMMEAALVLAAELQSFRAVDVFERWRAALLEVISVDYGGRVQRTTAPCNLPPLKIDAAQE